MSRVITIAVLIPLGIGIFAVIDPHSIVGKVGIIALGLGILVAAIAIRSKPVIPAPLAQPAVPVQDQPRPAQPRQPGFELNPSMPTPVAPEDMPKVELERRRAHNRAFEEGRQQGRAEGRAQVEAERPELTEDLILEIMDRAIKEGLRTAEGRAELLDMIAEAEEIDAPEPEPEPPGEFTWTTKAERDVWRARRKAEAAQSA